VARLATHRTLVNSAVLLSGIFTNATWPELTAMEARGEAGRLIEAHRSFVKFNLWLAGGIALLSIPLVPLVYPSWTAGRLAVDDVTIVLLVARTVVWAVWNASAVALMAANRHRPVVIALWWSALITVLISFVCVPWIGIRGAAFGLLLGDLAIAAWAVPLAACRSVGDVFRRFATGLAAAAWWGLAIPTAVGCALWLWLPTPSVRYTVAIPVAVACAAMLMYTRLSSAEHRILDRLVSRRALAEVT
jgi:O-antigen/teichoic acid export membrane protein